MQHAPMILLAEDDENDVLLFRLALEVLGAKNRLAVARDGAEVIAYLAGKHPFNDRTTHPLPDLVILDIKMPRMTGFDVLTWMGSANGVGKIPAVMLSSSHLAEDVGKATELGARDYFIKPRSVHDLAELIQTIQRKYLPS